MSAARVYLPVDAHDLDELAAAGRLATTGRLAYGVTPALEATTPRADDEEREYLVFLEAARTAVDLAHGARRVVLAADVRESGFTPAGEGVVIRLTGDLDLREIASFHVDEEPGGDVEDLLWYDVTEVHAVALLVRA
ncbi:MAG: hypothetical protein LKG20_01310 [Tetrasphaera jenkinsii]|jgi:hypothetical protein|nr:hypothetical protein [Tetrasphaera jenkinsii]